MLLFYPILGNKLCDAVSGSVAILMQTSHLHDLNTVFIRPFLKGNQLGASNIFLYKIKFCYRYEQ